MTHIWLWVIIILSVILQTTVVPFLHVGNARPDLPLMITVSIALIFGRTAGISVGFFSGLFWDLLTAQFFGMYTLAKLITGYIVGSFEEKVFKEHPLLPLIAVFLATFMHEIVLYICAYMLDIKTPFLALIAQNVVPAAIYNCLAMSFVYFFILHFRSRFWRGERQMNEI